MVCANGYESWLFMRHYYDTFALVLKNGDFMYRALTQFKGLTGLLQNKLYTDLLDMSTHGDKFPVASCFGGLAAYSPSSFFHPPCSYHTSVIGGVNGGPTLLQSLSPLLAAYEDSNGDVCEHVVFNMCLHLSRPQGLGISIQGDLLVFRDAELFTAVNNGTAVTVLFGCVVAGVFLRVWRWRARRARTGEGEKGRKRGGGGGREGGGGWMAALLGRISLPRRAGHRKGKLSDHDLAKLV